MNARILLIRLALGGALSGVLGGAVACSKPSAPAQTPAEKPAELVVQSASAAAALPAKVIDPVCEMEIDPKESISMTHEGKTIWFCSESCRQSFREDPAKYLGKK